MRDLTRPPGGARRIVDALLRQEDGGGKAIRSANLGGGLTRASRFSHSATHPAGEDRSEAPRRWPGRATATCVCAGCRAAPPPDAPAARRPTAPCLWRPAASHLPWRERVAARPRRQAVLVSRARLVASSGPCGASRGSSGAEHVLGKDGVGGSIPLHGTIAGRGSAPALTGAHCREPSIASIRAKRGLRRRRSTHVPCPRFTVAEHMSSGRSTSGKLIATLNAG